MKQTMKYLNMAYLVAVGAIMMGCSKAEESLLPEDMNNNNSVILSTTVGFDAEAETRALGIDYVNKQAVKTFAAGETMAIIYKNKSGNTVKAVSAALTDGDITTTADPATNKKSATFTFELTAPDKTQAVTYIYPAAMANSDGSVNYAALATQDGTLATLSSSLDLATYSNDWDGTSLPAGTLVNQLAVCALTLKNSDGSSTITSGLTEVTVSDGSNTYTVTPTGSNFGEATIYVAIRPVTAALEYTATNGTNNYTKTATSREYAAGNFYNLGLRMAAPAPSYTMAAAATSADKGKLICADGHIHANGADAECTAARVAKIIYLGTTGHATYTHGLALALTDEGQMAWEAAMTACNTTKNTSTPVTDATWLLASRDQWNYMLGTNGADSYTALRDGFGDITGASNLQSYGYWSSTERDANRARSYYFGVGGWGIDNKDVDEIWVRACLAF